jgi:hypothetical protein
MLAHASRQVQLCDRSSPLDKGKLIDWVNDLLLKENGLIRSIGQQMSTYL